MSENQTPQVVTETIEPTPTVVSEPIAEAPKAQEVAPTTVVRPEMDPKLSHKERIRVFCAGKSGRIELNSFLKSLYPIQRPPIPQFWTVQGVMKKLKLDLLELQAEGLFQLSPTSAQLGKTHFPDNTSGAAHQFNLGNLAIEVTLP